VASVRTINGSAPTVKIYYSHREPYLLRVRPETDNRLIFGGRVALDPKEGFRLAVAIPATEENLALARAAVALPVGWTVDAGRPRCPWTTPAVAVPGHERSCGACGRPPLRAGASIELRSERVTLKPDSKRAYYRDGVFRITVTNRGDKPAEVPALLSDDRGIRWTDSLIVVTVEPSEVRTVRTLARDGNPEGRIRSTVLAPGESASVQVDLFQYDLDRRDGRTIEVLFGLGERSCADSFYYENGNR
jgi:hypothetical protein